MILCCYKEAAWERGCCQMLFLTESFWMLSDVKEN